MCAVRPNITEPQRQLIAALDSMLGCDHPMLIASGMIRGLTNHFAPDSVKNARTPEELATYLTDIAKTAQYDLVAVCASKLSAEAIDVGSFELFLYKTSCCANVEYKQLVDAVLDSLEDSSET